ncbi:hypothetical protein VZT92_012642 [Zoarces viviparus]|uniref:Uncharacterized protein n=1 Tax=Zoarces viviparus TaxID=48416 RepID=A0AAW1F1L1_ZOAVI
MPGLWQGGLSDSSPRLSVRPLRLELKIDPRAFEGPLPRCQQHDVIMRPGRGPNTGLHFLCRQGMVRGYVPPCVLLDDDACYVGNGDADIFDVRIIIIYSTGGFTVDI